MSAVSGFASVNGEISTLSEAKVPVTDRGFLYGDSVYEVFRTYDGVPFLAPEHWQRLKRSADLIHIELDDTMQDLHAEIARTIAAWHDSGASGDAYVRYAYTRGGGPIDLAPPADLPTHRLIIVKAVPEWPAHHYAEGVTLAIPRVRRNPDNALSPSIKGGNYLNNVLGVLEARELGAEDCVFLNQDGYVTESSNSNVLFVIDGGVVSPSFESGILAGLTKDVVAEICSSAGISYTDRLLSVNDIGTTSECFITSATREIVPARSLRLEDGTIIEFPVGGGEITRSLRNLYKEYIEKYTQENQDSRLFDEESVRVA